MTAAKHLDPVVGIDMHMVQPPPPAPPVMLPVPYAGYLIDPDDYGGACTIYVNGLPRARAGTPGIGCPPHIPPGGMFVKPPTNECEMYMGSSTVLFDGEVASAQGHPVLSCHDVGMPAPVRAWKSAPAKSLMMPVSMVIPIPGAPVLIGGAPTITSSASASTQDEEEEPVLETIELEVYDAFGEPYADAKFELQLANGDVEEGTLDANGKATIADVPRGYALLVFPDVEDPPSDPPNPPEPSAGANDRPAEGAAGGGGGGSTTHVVQRGETLTKIARRYGLPSWRALYDHPSNAEFKRARPNPNVIRPGDVLHIETVTETTRKYPLGGLAVRTGEKTVVFLPPVEWLEFHLVDLAGAEAPLRATIDDGFSVRDVEVPDDHTLGFFVPVGGPPVKIVVLDKNEESFGAFVVRAGDLDPISDPRGLAERLRNLGYPVPKDDDCTHALWAFQEDRDIEPTGELDDATRDALTSVYGA